MQSVKAILGGRKRERGYINKRAAGREEEEEDGDEGTDVQLGQMSLVSDITYVVRCIDDIMIFDDQLD